MNSRRKRVVVALNYYAPYVSGVTEAARVVAEGHAREIMLCVKQIATDGRRNRVRNEDGEQQRLCAEKHRHQRGEDEPHQFWVVRTIGVPVRERSADAGVKVP